jgi:hypothetical protein
VLQGVETVGRRLGLTRERVRQLQVQALKQLETELADLAPVQTAAAGTTQTRELERGPASGRPAVAAPDYKWMGCVLWRDPLGFNRDAPDDEELAAHFATLAPSGPKTSSGWALEPKRQARSRPPCPADGRESNCVRSRRSGMGAPS